MNISKKVFIYPVFIVFLLFGLNLFSSSKGSDYIDLSGRYNSAFFVQDDKAYIGYANQVIKLDLNNGKIIKKYNIFDESLAYQTYSRSILVYKQNIFFRTYKKSNDILDDQYKDILFWYSIANKKTIKEIEVNGPDNIINLKDKDFVVCADKLIKLSEKKIYQITSLTLDKEKLINEFQEKSLKEITSQWAKWVIAPDGKCYALLTLYNSEGSKKSLVATKLYQYNFLDTTFKRKALNGYGMPFSLDDRSRLFSFINKNTMYILDFDKISNNINVYDISKEKVQKNISLEYPKTWGILALEKNKYVYYFNIEYSDDGINYSDEYGIKNLYQKLNIIIIDAPSSKTIRKISKVFYDEVFNRVNLFCVNKGVLYAIQDTGLGNDKKITAIDLLNNKKISEKAFDIKFVPQIITPQNKIIGFEKSNISDIKIVKINY